jgi:arylsulfatase A-like enzyme
MKAIMVMFDSLNRHLLPPYGCAWTHAPNFKRLAERTVAFETSYVCSMPCMPARRDLHTGRPNFLHRGWGPLEPFDDSCIELLSKAGVYTHLTSDHYHYWEDGGATYHTRYNTWEFFRGQEGDPCWGMVAEPPIPENRNGKGRRQDWVNRQFMQQEAQMSQPQTFAAGVEFIQRNAHADNWFLQIECFDPHEPFFSHRRYKDLYPHKYDGPLFDWPAYAPVNPETETSEMIQHIRFEYAALLTQCDAYLGDILDMMDKCHLWEDTLLILWTDHGFLLSEHNAWAKNWMPLYEEISHTPFFVWDPRIGKAGERRRSLVQPAIDLGPTLLEFFGVEHTPNMLGKPLRPVLESDTPIREAGFFGYHGKQVNVTDGRYVYMRGPATQENQPLFHYTHLPTAMRGFLGLENLAKMELAPPFTFTKNCPTMKIPVRVENDAQAGTASTWLWDIQTDPQQQTPLSDAVIEERMVNHLRNLLAEVDAPTEQYERLGITI